MNYPSIARGVARSNMEARGWQFEHDLPMRVPRRDLRGDKTIGTAALEGNGWRFVYGPGGELRLAHTQFSWHEHRAWRALYGVRTLASQPIVIFDDDRDQVVVAPKTIMRWFHGLLIAKWKRPYLEIATDAERDGTLHWYDGSSTPYLSMSAGEIIDLLLDPATEEVHRTVIEEARAAKYDELRRNAQTMLESVVILTSGYNSYALARIEVQGSSQARTNQLYKAAERLGIRPVTIDNPDRYIFQDGQIQRCSPLQFEAVYLDQFAHIANVLVLNPAVPFREANQTAVGEVEPRVFDVEFKTRTGSFYFPASAANLPPEYSRPSRPSRALVVVDRPNRRVVKGWGDDTLAGLHQVINGCELVMEEVRDGVFEAALTEEQLDDILS